TAIAPPAGNSALATQPRLRSASRPSRPTSSQPATTTSTQSRWIQRAGSKSPFMPASTAGLAWLGCLRHRLGRAPRSCRSGLRCLRGTRAARDVAHAVLREVLADELAHDLRGRQVLRRAEALER